MNTAIRFKLFVAGRTSVHMHSPNFVLVMVFNSTAHGLHNGPPLAGINSFLHFKQFMVVSPCLVFSTL